jgi:hypothetical protein
LKREDKLRDDLLFFVKLSPSTLDKKSSSATDVEQDQAKTTVLLICDSAGNEDGCFCSG